MWTGPFVVPYVYGRMITVKTMEGSMRFLCNPFRLKPFYDESSVKDSYVNHITEVISKGDLREKLFTKAKKDELAARSRLEAWNIIHKDTVPKDANIKGGHFVLTVKDDGTENDLWKARLVV